MRRSEKIMNIPTMRELKEHFLSREFILFLAIGCVNTFDCSLLSTLLAPFLGDINLAFNVGYMLSNVIAYLLSACFVFPTPLSWLGWVRFFLSYVPNYLVQNVLVVALYNLMGIPPVRSFIISAVLGIPATFILVKFFAFGK